jgi:hypothetical protein
MGRPIQQAEPECCTEKEAFRDPIDRWVGELKREIVINNVTNGFIVTIGCKSFVIVSIEELLADLELIYTDPRTVIKKYLPYLEATR